MQDNCSGTARLDIRKKRIESKAPHSHKFNDESSMIKNSQNENLQDTNKSGGRQLKLNPSCVQYVAKT